VDVFVPDRDCESFEEICKWLISVSRFCLCYLGGCVWVNVDTFEAKEGVCICCSCFCRLVKVVVTVGE